MVIWRLYYSCVSIFGMPTLLLNLINRLCKALLNARNCKLKKKQPSLILTIIKANHFLFLANVVDINKMADNEGTFVCTQVIAHPSDEACDHVGIIQLQDTTKQSSGFFCVLPRRNPGFYFLTGTIIFYVSNCVNAK